MFNLENIPLLTKVQATKVLHELNEDSESMVEDYAIRPIYEWLPDKEKLENEDYYYKHFAEDEYLTGMEIYSSNKIHRKFCNDLLLFCGLTFQASEIYIQQKERFTAVQSVIFEHVTKCAFWHETGMAMLTIKKV